MHLSSPPRPFGILRGKLLMRDNVNGAKKEEKKMHVLLIYTFAWLDWSAAKKTDVVLAYFFQLNHHMGRTVGLAYVRQPLPVPPPPR